VGIPWRHWLVVVLEGNILIKIDLMIQKEEPWFGKEKSAGCARPRRSNAWTIGAALNASPVAEVQLGI